MNRRDFLKAIAATAVVIAAPPALASLPAGRWVRGVQALPGGYTASVYFYTTKLNNAELQMLTAFNPPGGVPEIELDENSPVHFVRSGSAFRCVTNDGDPIGSLTPCYAQVEQGAFPTSYIETEGSPATRPSTRAAVGADGRIDMGNARHDFDQDGKWLGVLVEESRENLCLYSRIPELKTEVK